jgi:pimeloyl-ACP methyl ester carboxylesterase
VTRPPPNPRFAIPAPLRLSFRTLSAVAPGPTARLAWHIFAKPPRKPRPDRYDVLPEAETLTVRAAGHDLPAWAWGEGPPVLLLHGWGSSAASMTAFVRPLTHAGFRVVTYDAFAHGVSPGVTTSGPEMARHLNEIADRLGAQHIVAHSMGTVVAGFAIRAGLDVERMALLNAPADMPHFLTLFARGLGFSPAVERRMIRRFEEEHDVRWEDCVVEWVAEGHDAPTLLVHDDSDVDVPWPHAERVRSAWQNNHAITTRSLGHRGGLHAPAVLSATVDFLSGRDAGLPTEVAASDQQAG